MSAIASPTIRIYSITISKTLRALSLGLLALPCLAQAISAAEVARPVSTSSERTVQDNAVRPFISRIGRGT
jgi:hypothetical protein